MSTVLAALPAVENEGSRTAESEDSKNDGGKVVGRAVASDALGDRSTKDVFGAASTA